MKNARSDQDCGNQTPLFGLHAVQWGFETFLKHTDIPAPEYYSEDAEKKHLYADNQKAQQNGRQDIPFPFSDKKAAAAESRQAPGTEAKRPVQSLKDNPVQCQNKEYQYSQDYSKWRRRLWQNIRLRRRQMPQEVPAPDQRHFPKPCVHAHIYPAWPVPPAAQNHRS